MGPKTAFFAWIYDDIGTNDKFRTNRAVYKWKSVYSSVKVSYVSTNLMSVGPQTTLTNYTCMAHIEFRANLQ